MLKSLGYMNPSDAWNKTETVSQTLHDSVDFFWVAESMQQLS